MVERTADQELRRQLLHIVADLTYADDPTNPGAKRRGRVRNARRKAIAILTALDELDGAIPQIRDAGDNAP